MKLMNPRGPAKSVPETERPSTLPQHEQTSRQREPYSYYLRKIARLVVNYMWLVRYDSLFIILTYLVSDTFLAYLGGICSSETLVLTSKSRMEG